MPIRSVEEVKAKEAEKAANAKLPKAILMRDMDEPDNATFVDQDEETDSEYEEMFDDEVGSGWTEIWKKQNVPQVS